MIDPMKIMETLATDDSVKLSDDEIKLILGGLGELPAKMSINLLIRLENILRQREQGKQDGNNVHMESSQG